MRRIIPAVFGLLALFSALPAHAVLVEWDFAGTGSIVDPDGYVGGTASYVPFSGSFVYSTEATLLYSFPYQPPDEGSSATYSMGPPLGSVGLALSFRNVRVAADATQPLYLTMQDLLPSNPGNRTDALALYTSFPVSQDVGIDPTTYNYFDITFLDSGGNVFSGTGIPSVLDFAAFGDAQLVLQVRDPVDINTVLWQVTGPIQSLSHPVPEPASLVLLALGVVAVAAHWVAVARTRRL